MDVYGLCWTPSGIVRGNCHMQRYMHLCHVRLTVYVRCFPPIYLHHPSRKEWMSTTPSPYSRSHTESNSWPTNNVPARFPLLLPISVPGMATGSSSGKEEREALKPPPFHTNPGGPARRITFCTSVCIRRSALSLSKDVLSRPQHQSLSKVGFSEPTKTRGPNGPL